MKDSPLERVLLGTAVGDSLGLPAEGISPRRIARWWPGPWRQRFLFGRGMVSDDTEHSVFVAQSLLAASSDAGEFQRQLAGRLRLWLLGVPAGIGFATLRAIFKLWIGFPPSRSGVFSAGNGPAMRSAVIGVFFATEPGRLEEFVRASTRLTHTDPRAEIAARAVAFTAAWCVRTPNEPDRKAMTNLWRSAGSNDPEWMALVENLGRAHERGWAVRDLACELGLENGVGGYAYHSVPVALYAWWRHGGDFRASVEAVLNCGGDADTVGAITGALAALRSPVPLEWVETIGDRPISPDYLSELGRTLEAAQKGESPLAPPFAWFVIPFRNLLFLLVVLVHGLRRLVP